MWLLSASDVAGATEVQISTRQHHLWLMPLQQASEPQRSAWLSSAEGGGAHGRGRPPWAAALPTPAGGPAPKRSLLWGSPGFRAGPARGSRYVLAGGLSGNAQLTLCPICQTQREAVGAQRPLPGVSREQMDRPAVPRVLGEWGRAGHGPECPPLGAPTLYPSAHPLASLMFQPVGGRRGSTGQGLGTAAPGPPSAKLVPAEDGPARPCGAGGVARVRVPTRPRDDRIISECSVSPLNTTHSSSCRPLGPDATSERADFPPLC